MAKKFELRQKQSLAAAIAEAFVSVDSDFDFTALGNKLQTLVQQSYPPPPDPSGLGTLGWIDVQKICLNYLIYECNGETWQVNFTLTETGEPTIVSRVAVEPVFVPIAESQIFHANIAESFEGSLIASQASEKGYVWDIQIFQEGPTKAAQINGNDYLNEFPQLRGKKLRAVYLAEAVHGAIADRIFDLAPLILRAVADHRSFQEGRSRKLSVNEEAEQMAGAIMSTRVAESLDNPNKIAARARVDLRRIGSGKELRDFLMGRIAEGIAIPYECSWTGAVDYRIKNPSDTEPTFEVVKITQVMSVDPVFRGNAGGKFVRLAESLNTMKTKKKTSIALLAGQLMAKFPKQYARLAEAEDDAEEGSPEDINTLVAEAFLADPANAPLKEMFPTVDDLMKQESAMASIVKWAKAKLTAPAEPDADDAEDADGDDTTDGADAGAVAESLRGKRQGQSVLDKRIAALEAANLKANSERNTLIAESFIEKETAKMPENLQAYVRNIAKMSNLTDTAKLGELIRDTKKNMFMAESFNGHRIDLSVDESQKQYDAVLNLIGRGQLVRPEVKKWIAESLGRNPFTKKDESIMSIKTMLREFDGVDTMKAGGFGVDRHGRVSESYDPAITVQLAYDAMHLFLQAEWEVPDDIYGAWKKITGTTSAQDFLNVNNENFGRFKADDIQVRVDQSADYQELTMQGAENAPYAILDYAFLFSIYWRDFVNDSVGKFQRLPGEMAGVFNEKIYNAVMDLVWNAPFQLWTGATEDNGSGTMAAVTANMVDSHWGNNPTTPAALSYASVMADYLRLFSAAQLGSSQITGAMPKYLLTMLKDYSTGYQITRPIQERPDVAPLTTTGQQAIAIPGLTSLTSGAAPLEHIVVPRWDSKWNANGTGGYSRWALVCSPDRQPAIQVFNYIGITQPVLMQEAVGTGKSFTADAIRMKEKYPHNVGLINPRGFLVDAVS